MPVSIESASKTMFFNSTAPLGWTKLTTNDDCAVRIVSGTTSSGGTRNFSTVFTTQTATGDIAMTNFVMNPTAAASPAHTHTRNYSPGISAGAVPSSFSRTAYPVTGPSTAYPTTPAGGGGGHAHPAYSPAPFSISGSLGIEVRYVDAILAQRN